MTEPVKALGDNRVVAVLRAPTTVRFAAIVETLYEAGLRAVELTMTSTGAATEISRLRTQGPDDLLVGAGTVRTADRAREACEHGAQFLVSQVTSAAVHHIAQEAHVAHIPGALTPNEIVRAWELGVPAVKVSPIGPLGGLDYLRELRGPLPDVALFPTGGVCPRDVAAYLAEGAAVVGVSGAFLQDAFDTNSDLHALGTRARSLMTAIEDAGTMINTKTKETI